jgi:hypothetical protein
VNANIKQLGLIKNEERIKSGFARTYMVIVKSRSEERPFVMNM